MLGGSPSVAEPGPIRAIIPATVSGGNEEIVVRMRRAYEAFNRGDFDAAMEMVDPGFEFVRRPGGMQPLSGGDAFRGWMEPDAFAENVVEPVDIRTRGDKMLVRQRARALGAGSGIEVRNETWAVWTVNAAGRATRLEVFQADEEAQAREAAGLD